MTAEAAPTPTDDAWQRVSAIVVTHHSGGVIRQCLERLGKAAKIVVVDNASDDDTLDIVSRTAPDSHLTRNWIGVGYGNGASQGLANVQTEFALLVNPDAVASDDAVSRLYRESNTTAGEQLSIVALCRYGSGYQSTQSDLDMLIVQP